MKSKLYFLFISLCLLSQVYSQNLTVTAPVNNNFNASNVIPNGTTDHRTIRTHFIIPASELQGIPNGTVITQLGVNIQNGASGPASGNLQMYLENTTDVVNNKSPDWSVAVGTMTSVYNGPFTIPTATGPADFTISTPFTYNGGGIYVAYDYAGTIFSNLPASYPVNTLIPNGCRTAATTTTTPADSVNTLTGIRPEIRFTFLNPFTNNLAVSQIRPEYGISNSFVVDDNEVYVEILNLGTQTMTNVPVDLNLIGTNTYSTSQTITSIAPNASEILTFTGVPVGSVPSQIIRVTVPSDQQTFNDTIEYVQTISCDSLGYNSIEAGTASVGYNTGSGFIGIRYDISNLVPVNIKSVDIRVGANAASVGNTIKGLLLNSAGVVVDSTLPHVITLGDLGDPLSLPLLGANTNYANQTVFPGIRQTPTIGAGYFPLATQVQFNQTPNKNVSTGINGGTITYQNTLPPFMVSMTLEPRPFIVFSNSSGPVCAGSPLEIGLFPLAYDTYSLFENMVLIQSNNTGSFTVSPATTTTYDIVVEKNSCPGQTGTFTAQVVSEYNITLNESFCTGDPFDFNGTPLSAPGQYIDTLTAIGGCDSIITLNLDELATSNFFFSENICTGETYTFAGQNLTTTGIYNDTLTNSVGCDSTITLDLTVGADVSVTVSGGGVLTAGATGPDVTYQWIDCDNNNTPIAGATSQTFSAIDFGITGNYAVQVTQGNCTDTSPCMAIDFTGISETSNLKVSLYPNPAKHALFVSLNTKENVTYSIFDIGGKIVQTGSVGNNEAINISDLENGGYVIEFKSDIGEMKNLFFKH